MLDPSVIAEKDDNDSVIGLFAAFLESMSAITSKPEWRPGSTKRNFEVGLAATFAAYMKSTLSPTTVASMAILFEYGKFLADLDIEAKMHRHVLVQFCKSMVTELGKDEPHLDSRAMARVLHETLFKPAMPAVKSLIHFCFFEYKAYRTRLVQMSNAPVAWQKAIRAILPFLYTSKLVPIYTITYSPNIVVPEGTSTPAFFSNEIRKPQPFYSRLFTQDEIAVHQNEQKIIDETYAHLSAVIMATAMMGDAHFDHIQKEIEALCRATRCIEARERIIVLHTQQLSIPRFFADHLRDIVRVNCP